MANIEKELQVRLQLKYDSFENWSSKNPTLRAGEVAIAYLTTAGAVAPAEGDTQHPVLFKVGPGAFNSLPWASALAADVHTWAKKTESEFTSWVKGLIKVTDIDAYSKAQVDNMLAANATADQKYAKDYADGLAKNYDAAGTAQTLIEDLDVTDTAVTGQYVSAVSETDGKISVTRADLPTYTLASGSANGTVAFNGNDVAVKGLGSAAYTDAKAYDAAGSAATAKSEAIADAESKVNALANGAVKANTEAIAAINNGTSGLLAQAQAYADQAEADAVATAAADATSKVDALANGAVKDNADAIAGIKNGAKVNDFAAAEAAIADAKKAGTDANAALEAYKTSNDKALADEIARAKEAEAKALTDAKAYTDDMKDAILGEGIKDTFDTLKEIQDWIEGDGVNATELSGAIAAEAKTRGEEVTRLEGLIEDNAEAIEALGIVDGKVADAVHADSADDASKLGGVEASKYALKTDAQGYASTAKSEAIEAAAEDATSKADKAKEDAIAAAASDATTKANTAKSEAIAAAAKDATSKANTAKSEAIADANAHTDEVIKNYYTKTEADAAFMDSTETGAAIDAKITALNLANTYEPIGAETRAKAYADGLAGNYATAAQGAKADSALQSVEVGTGLKVSEKTNNKQTIEIDDTVVFVFNCGNASTLVD